MAIPLGLDPQNTPRESFWKKDDAIDWEGTPLEAREQYDRTGEGRFLQLRPQPDRPPTRITLRALTARERAYVRGECGRLVSGGSYTANPVLWTYLACAFALDFPDYPTQIALPGGLRIDKWSTEGGCRRLSEPLMELLTRGLGEEFWLFYGGLVLRASEASAQDFFPSSPGSTP